MKFESALELKNRVMPALLITEERLKNKGYNISTEDIWFYLKQNKWSHDKNLTLNEIVNDILKFDETVLTRGDRIGQ